VGNKYNGRHKKVDSNKVPSIASDDYCNHASAYETSRHEVSGTTIIYMSCECGASYSVHE
jgi:hypothetical protein